MRGNQRLLVIAAAVVVVVVAFIIISPGGDDGNDSASTTSTPTTASQPAGDATTPAQTTTTPAADTNTVNATVTVVDAKPQGGIETINAKKGQDLHLVVKSDTADEIHVHGYDVKKDVEAGGSVTFDIPLKIDGIFVIELESHGEQIAKLVVEP
jgi:copper(I)-binding protein